MNTWEIIDKISESELTTQLKLSISNDNTDRSYDNTPDSINKIINVNWTLTPEFSSSDSETENSLLIKNTNNNPTNANTNSHRDSTNSYPNNTVINIDDNMFRDRNPEPGNTRLFVKTLVVSGVIIAGFYFYKTF